MLLLRTIYIYKRGGVVYRYPSPIPGLSYHHPNHILYMFFRLQSISMVESVEDRRLRCNPPVFLRSGVPGERDLER